MDTTVGLQRFDMVGAEARGTLAAELLGALDSQDDAWELELSAIAAMVVDALLNADAAALDELIEPLRNAHIEAVGANGYGREISGYLAALLSAVGTAVDRLPDPREFAVADGSQAQQMLEALDSGPQTSQELRRKLGTGDSQLSRVGRTLLAAGLVTQRRAGRVAIWEATPRGHMLAQGRPEPQRGRR